MKKLLALLLCLVLVVALLASCGQRRRAGSDSEEEETSSETVKKDTGTDEPDPGKTDGPETKTASVVGEWKMDISKMSDEDLLSSFSSGVTSANPGVDISMLSNEIDLRGLVEEMTDVYEIRFQKDGTYVVVVDLEDFSKAYLSIMEEVFGVMSKLSIEEYAKLAGMDGETLAALKENLTKAGMSWESFLSQSMQTVLSQMKTQLKNPEALKEAVGISDDAGATIEGDALTISGEWTQEGSSVELHTKSGSVVVFEMNADGNRMELTSRSGNDSVFPEGITLERAD